MHGLCGRIVSKTLSPKSQPIARLEVMILALYKIGTPCGFQHAEHCTEPQASFASQARLASSSDMRGADVSAAATGEGAGEDDVGETTPFHDGSVSNLASHACLAASSEVNTVELSGVYD